MASASSMSRLAAPKSSPSCDRDRQPPLVRFAAACRRRSIAGTSDAWPICRRTVVASGSGWWFDDFDVGARVAQGRYSPSGLTTRSRSRSRAARRGCRRSSANSASPWVAAQDKASPDGSCCRSARTRCFGSCAPMHPDGTRRRMLWGSMIGRGSAGTAMERSSAISSGGASWMFCLTARPRPSKHGSRHGPRFACLARSRRRIQPGGQPGAAQSETGRRSLASA